MIAYFLSIILAFAPLGIYPVVRTLYTRTQYDCIGINNKCILENAKDKNNKYGIYITDKEKFSSSLQGLLLLHNNCDCEEEECACNCNWNCNDFFCPDKIGHTPYIYMNNLCLVESKNVHKQELAIKTEYKSIYKKCKCDDERGFFDSLCLCNCEEDCDSLSCPNKIK